MVHAVQPAIVVDHPEDFDLVVGEGVGRGPGNHGDQGWRRQTTARARVVHEGGQYCSAVIGSASPRAKVCTKLRTEDLLMELLADLDQDCVLGGGHHMQVSVSYCCVSSHSITQVQSARSWYGPTRTQVSTRRTTPYQATMARSVGHLQGYLMIAPGDSEIGFTAWLPVTDCVMRPTFW